MLTIKKEGTAMANQATQIRLDPELNTPDGETLAAIYNTLHGVNLSREFHSVEELKADLNADGSETEQ